MDNPTISSWDQICLGDLLAAFRKAKADGFFERSAYVAEDFALYEQELFKNLRTLQRRLRNGKIDQVLAEAQRNRAPSVFAKGVRLQPRLGTSENPDTREVADVHAFFSDANRAFEQLNDKNRIEPEFRLVGDFDVAMHILSGLWINLIGHKYDARLTGHAYGSRVRRHGRDGSMDPPKGPYQYEAVGSFDPYFQPYRRWRDAGVATIRRSLEAGEAVIAVTLDFSSYYHSIDPSFMTDDRFLAVIDLRLSDWEKAFTTSLIEALKAWGARAAALIEPQDASRTGRGGGLPIGLSAVRIITNVLLYAFDEKFLGSLHPIYYGRYVDDVLLVIRDSGQVRTTAELWEHIETCAPIFKREGPEPGDVAVDLGDYQGETRLRLKPSKQRVFFLEGQAGLDLLNNIRHQVTTLSSERRLMPRVEEMDLSASARALAAATDAAEEPDVLRRADGLTLRRLGWALQLRSAEILARDLDRSAWTADRKRFYAFAGSHILRPDKILEHVDYLARLISLAVSLGDWTQALEMHERAVASIATLKTAVAGGMCQINGEEAQASNQIWGSFQRWVKNACREAILKALPWDSNTGEACHFTRSARQLFARLDIPEGEAAKLAIMLRESDWGKRPYKEHLRWDAQDERAPIAGEEDLAEILVQRSEVGRFRELERFLVSTWHEEKTTGVRRVNARCAQAGTPASGSRLPYLLATRPYTPQEIALYCPGECVFGPRNTALKRWGAYTHAVRGAWRPLSDDIVEDHPQAPPGDSADVRLVANLGGASGDRPMHLGITSLKTTKESWEAAAAGRPDRSTARYGRLATIVNLAIRARPRPTHLLLPELSLPESWLETVSQILLESEISLIAGLDYQHYGEKEIGSSAALVLRDGRLGFASSLQIRQPKLLAAPGEEEDLHRSFGKQWKDWRHAPDPHPVYAHEGIHFGVLVCSELQNIGHRARFQGEVDLLAILSWNQDLETFSALVESASLDVHAYIALVNNRAYGDSRVRAPRKADYERDLCRVRGGENEQLVVVKIDPADLRAQQSRATRWRKPRDKYKPAPEGFLISPRRKGIPS